MAPFAPNSKILPPAKTGILLAAFGSSSQRGETALSVFAEKTRRVFPGIPVRWAFTSEMVRSRLAASGKKTDSLHKALLRMSFERYTHIAVQSLQLIPGVEYETLLDEVGRVGEEAEDLRIQVGLPLLYTEKDIADAAAALLKHLPAERKREDIVVCVGHGTWHRSAACYESLSAHLRKVDPHIFVGTLEGERQVEDLLPKLPSGSGVVWLLPLLSVIGKHAEVDIAGAEPGSWKSRLEAAGMECRVVLQGTVEYDGFADIWLGHLSDTVARLTRR